MAEKGTIWVLFLLTLLMALLEGAGVGMLLPILAFIKSGAVSGDGAIQAFMQRAVDLCGVLGSEYRLPLLLLTAFLIIFTRYFINYLRDAKLAKVRLGLIRKLRHNLGSALINSKMGHLTEIRSGELQTSLTVECERAAESAAAQVAIFTSLVLILVYVALLLALSPLLTLCTIPIMGLVGLVLNWQRRKSKNLTEKVSRQNLNLGDQVSEIIGGISRIKMRGQQKATSKKLFKTVDGIFSGMLSLERLRLMVEISMHPLLALAGLLVIFIAVELIQVDLAVLGVFIFVLLRMAPQVNMLASLWSYKNSCRASLAKVSGLIQKAEENREPEGGSKPVPRGIPGFTLSNVSFRYPGLKNSRYALDEINCYVPAGSLTAVVGRSGAGKSTLINLLASHHAPATGEVRFSGLPLKQYRLRDLRRCIGLVEQNPFLFNDTIRENLGFGVDPPPNDEELEQALLRSGSWEFVQKLEMGLDTMAGERGSRLSQGQKQRLAIAHALAVKARVLILDEPTSALDRTSEMVIARTLRSLAGQLTVVVIAHRLETVKRADLILVLERGRLVAKGDHNSLLKTCKIYQELFGSA